MAHEDEIIAQALTILEERVKYSANDYLTSPSAVREYLRLRIGHLEHEEFWAVWLTSQSQVIECEQLFTGTINQTSVYPREVVKKALKHNAAAVIFAHNHPSGSGEPSRADETLTNTLKQTLDLVDVKVLDHFVVTSQKIVSFAEKGLI